MYRRRPAARTDRDLASGPGKLTQALAITRAHNGVDMTRGDLVVREPDRRRFRRDRRHAANRYHEVRRFAAAVPREREPIHQPITGIGHHRKMAGELWLIRHGETDMEPFRRAYGTHGFAAYARG